MRKAAVVALGKFGQAGGGANFIVVHDHELAVLDPLPLWVTRLFQALVRCCNFRTGAGRVSYEHLVAMLQPIQPRSGPRHFVPNLQAIKKVIRLLELRRIVGRDTGHSQAEKTLIYELAPRYAKLRPQAKLEPQTRTPVDSRKSSNDAASSPANSGTRTPNSNPVFKSGSLHKESASYPPVDKSKSELKRIRNEIAGRARVPLK